MNIFMYRAYGVLRDLHLDTMKISVYKAYGVLRDLPLDTIDISVYDRTSHIAHRTIGMLLPLHS